MQSPTNNRPVINGRNTVIFFIQAWVGNESMKMPAYIP